MFWRHAAHPGARPCGENLVEKKAAQEGLEPSTVRLTTDCSTFELQGNIAVPKSGWSESNRRSPAPQAGGLPGFPTSCEPSIRERPGGFEPPHPPWQGGRLPGYIMDANDSDARTPAAGIEPASSRLQRDAPPLSCTGKHPTLREPAVGLEPTVCRLTRAVPCLSSIAGLGSDTKYPWQESNLHNFRLRRAACLRHTPGIERKLRGLDSNQH